VSSISFRRSVMASLVATSVAMAAYGAHVAGATDPPPNVLKRWAATMGGDQSLTLEQALENARNFDLIAGHPRAFAPYLERMRAVNPDLKMVFYLNGAYAQKNEGTKYPESWYARDRAGNKVRSRGFGNYLMDVANPAWAADRAAACKAGIAKAGWNGCYADMLGVAPLGQGYGTGLPVNPATGDVWTPGSYIAATAVIGGVIKAANSDAIVVGNGLNNGHYYYDADQGTARNLLATLDGGNAQGWLRGTSQSVEKFKKEPVWKQNVDMLGDAGARGKSVLAMTKIWHTPATEAQKAAVHRYALASFLLGTDGKQYWFWSDRGYEGAAAQDAAYEHVNVGQPLGSYAAVGTAYVRHFTNGVAVVNPTTSPVTVDLGGSYRSLDGVTAAAVTLAPNTGDVYSR